MRSWIRSRWRVVVAASAAAALVATLGFWAIDQNPAPRFDCSTLSAQTAEGAADLARGCNADVEVLAARTEWQTSFATSDNQTRLEVSTVPVRVNVDGEWVEPDPTLEFADAADGTPIVEVSAPVFPIELNAGGLAGRGAPLGTIERDGHTLEVWFPLELPVPELAETQAVYKLADGIRLLVSVSTDGAGFLPVVELADTEAAGRFTALLQEARELRGGVSSGMDIEFATELSEGLSLKPDTEGAVHVIDSEGETQFLTSSPLMWDSSGRQSSLKSSVTEVGLTDRTRAPGDGDQLVSMGVDVIDRSIVISPDTAMIESPETVWPVYIDPTISGRTASRWVAVRSGGYTGTLQNWGDISSSMLGQGVGNCTATASCNAVFKQRLAWHYSGLDTISALAGSDISAASFSVDGQHSYNCTNQTTTLYRTSGLSTSTTWSNLSWLDSLTSRSEYHSNTCGDKGFRSFNALTGARWAADNNSSTLSLGLRVSETTMTPWKRFRHNATLSITYNRAPKVPTSLRLASPDVPNCVTGVGRPVIATTTPTLSATTSDPDGTNSQTSFVVASATDQSDVRWSSGNLTAVAPNVPKTAKVPSGLVNGGVYAWKARAFDGSLYSAWSGWCEFAVDTSAPPQPTVIPQMTGAPAVYLENVAGGGAQQLGKFALSPGGPGAVAGYQYGFNDPTATSTVAAAADGSAVIAFNPTTVGTVTLTVRARNLAGTLGLSKNYVFVVASPTEDGIWMLDEGAGTSAADTVGEPGRPLTIAGAEWADGPHALFDSRVGDHALRFDGINDAATTTAQVVDTTESFVVSAHVWLDDDKVGNGESFTALSQDGSAISGFDLGYSATCSGAANGCWSFSMPDDATGSGSIAAQSDEVVKGGEWTHLLAEHNVQAGTVSLWVCEIGTPEDPAIGDPKKTTKSRTATPWSAAGVFAVGRGLSSGAAAQWWPGVIDNTRVFSGEVLAESKIRRLCQGAEASDFSNTAEPLDPTSGVTQ